MVSEYIKAYSQEGEIILDPFLGSGVTVIEALRLGRKAVGVDLDPISAFITRNTIAPVDLNKFREAFDKIENNMKQSINNLYKTKCGNKKCSKEVIAEAVIWNDGTPKEIRYSCSCKTGSLWKQVDDEDLKNLKDIDSRKINYWYPDTELIWNTRINVHKGTKVSDLFTKRNLLALSMILEEIGKIKDRTIENLLKFTFSSALPQSSKLVFVIRQRGRSGGAVKEETKEVGSWATRGYWIPKEYFEINAWNCLEERFDKIFRGKKQSNIEINKVNEVSNFSELKKKENNVLLITKSCLNLSEITKNSIDYIFTDPPYGDSVPYLELDLMWNAWQKFKVNFDDEIIISNSPLRNKTFDIYEKMLSTAFVEMFRVLKADRYMTVTFHNTDIKIWNSIIRAVAYAGFDLEKIIYQPPARQSAKGLLALYASAVGDYYIRFKKPKGNKPVSAADIDQARYERIVVESTKKILAERGEPTPYTHILNGVIVALRKEGALLTGDKNPDNVLKEHKDKEFKSIDVEDKKGKVLGQKWWFSDASTVPFLEIVPLSDRLETAIIEVLNRKTKISFDDVLQEIFIKFPNALTPDSQDVKDLLEEYAAQTEDGNWMLKPMLKIRESEHSEMIYYISQIGKRMGYKIWIGKKEQGATYQKKKLFNFCDYNIQKLKNINEDILDKIQNIDILWINEDRIDSEFEVENTTAITESIIRGGNIPYRVKRFIILPEERAEFYHRKIKEPLLVDRIKDDCWQNIFYTKLKEFFIESKRHKIKFSDFEEIISQKAAIEETGQKRFEF